MTAIYQAPDIKRIATRPVKAKAIQFLYQGSTDETLRFVRKMEACLGVSISCAGDQGALFCHLELDRFRSPILNHGDWVVVDSFGKVSAVKDEDFKVYYEPENA
jgi:hypothetical protein